MIHLIQIELIDFCIPFVCLIVRTAHNIYTSQLENDKVHVVRMLLCFDRFVDQIWLS